jgi:hypothetical protein
MFINIYVFVFKNKSDWNTLKNGYGWIVSECFVLFGSI